MIASSKQLPIKFMLGGNNMTKSSFLKRSVSLFLVGIILSSVVIFAFAASATSDPYKWKVGSTNFSNESSVSTTGRTVKGVGTIRSSVVEPAGYLGAKGYVIDSSYVIRTSSVWMYSEVALSGFGMTATFNALPQDGGDYMAQGETAYYRNGSYTPNGLMAHHLYCFTIINRRDIYEKQSSYSLCISQLPCARGHYWVNAYFIGFF